MVKISCLGRFEKFNIKINKNKNFVHHMFSIPKIEKIQVWNAFYILKSNSTSFMLNIFFSMMNIKKIKTQVDKGEVGEPSKSPLRSGNRSIYYIISIQYKHIYAFNWMIMGSLVVSIQFLIYNTCLIFISKHLCLLTYKFI